MDRFELEGQVYYQQGRKCGKVGCRCAVGNLHGPYWYRRDVITGEVKYVGRGLPPDVVATRKAHDAMLPLMVQERWRLIAQADALARLIGNEPLRDGDRVVIEALGFGAALVSEPASRPAQDEDRDG